MIALENNSLVFRFPELDESACFEMAFQRTLRIPDDGRIYPLPAGLGEFPLVHVDDHAPGLPARMVRRGGVLMPMWQSEAMWISFFAPNDYPFAVKIATGKINAVSGKPWTEELRDDPQDYVVVTEQPWLDGYCVAQGLVRQFVAARLGEGATVEEQIAGTAEHGGLQVIAYPMKREVFARKLLRRDTHIVAHLCESGGSEMGFAPGGKMRQEIHADPHGIDAWEQSVSSRCFVSIPNAENWKEMTGMDAPTQPISRDQYRASGIPWFNYSNGSTAAVEGSSVLDKVKSIFDGSEPADAPPTNVKNIGPFPRPIREPQ